MSLYGAMITGIASLDANSQAMSIFSSNIANVNTIGYKDVSASFSTMLTSMFGAINSAGVMAVGQQNVTQQGLLQAAGSATDLGIAGNGFFAVSKTTTQSAAGASYYTRAGNFVPDANGNLQNGAGFYLMGWPVNSDGSLKNGNTLSAINIGSLAGKAQLTANVTFQANLQASAAIVQPYNMGDMSSVPPKVTPEFSRTVNVYDSQGGSQALTINYVKTGTNTWNYEVSYGGNMSNIDPSKIPPNSTMVAAGQLTFNSDGSLNATSNLNVLTGTANSDTKDVSFDIPWSSTSGLQDLVKYPNGQPITVNVGTIGKTDGVTQFDSPSTLLNSTVDGAVFGNVTGVNVDSNGFVTAHYSNGLTQKVYQIPLATFTNANGLTAVSGDAYQASANSGNGTLNASNTGGTGQISGGALEASTVDLATEFTNLITTQRAYSASARIVTTADTMLQTLEQLPST